MFDVCARLEQASKNRNFYLSSTASIRVQTILQLCMAKKTKIKYYNEIPTTVYNKTKSDPNRACFQSLKNLKK
jgi:hypothetical protein